MLSNLGSGLQDLSKITTFVSAVARSFIGRWSGGGASGPTNPQSARPSVVEMHEHNGVLRMYVGISWRAL